MIVDTLFFSSSFMVRVSTTFDNLKYTTTNKLVLYWIAMFINISGKISFYHRTKYKRGIFEESDSSVQH